MQPSTRSSNNPALRFEAEAMETLVASLKNQGYVVLGPTIQEGAVVFERINSAADFPHGMTDEQQPGAYRLKQRNDRAMFGYAVGPKSPKSFLFPPLFKLLSIAKDDHQFRIVSNRIEGDHPPRYALVGVRPCELQAIFLQDNVFMNQVFKDEAYQTIRENLFIVVVNCGQPASTCFCSSMQTGPEAKTGFDLALTEVVGEGHYFVVETGSQRGQKLMAGIPHSEASDTDRREADRIIRTAEQSIKRKLETTGLKELLQRNTDHPRWEEVGKRCLTCANCTLVCPTCFCVAVEDTTDLTGAIAERWRAWDSCFTVDFSYIHGGSLRMSAKSRYRQWMTHKLANWIDQFGTSGCVGCGRCITWCPVGIDLTEEAKHIREHQQVSGSS
ncbi:MAG: 4Fe-4S dicluster domain-containing protein [Bacteroidota bacterium]